MTVADPEVVQELWTSKQKIFDKSGEFQYHFHHFFGDSFLFQKGDALWKAKRKATSHAFYKERMVEMTQTLKGKIGTYCEQWAKEAGQNKDGVARVNINNAF